MTVFISYAKEDRDTARRLYDDLRNDGITLWFDEEELLPGQDQKLIIADVIRKSRFFIALLSSKSLTTRGFVRKEMEIALDMLGELPADGIFIIPVRIDDCKPMNESLLRLYPADLFPSYEVGLAKILRVLRPRENNIPPPLPYADPSSLSHPGGAIDVKSPFYIRRAVDEQVFSGVNKQRGLVTIHASRQIGKTSMMMQIFANIRRDTAIRPVFVDFQALEAEDFQSLNAIWYAISAQADAQLGTECRISEIWNPDASYDRNLSVFLDKFVFKQADTPMLICLDEVDRVFSTPVKADFFSSLRAFYNRGAMDPAWKKIRWLLSTSSEPGFFIEDLNQSPFNIGLTVKLNAFNAEEIAEFSKRHGMLCDSSMIGKIMDYLGGRPYLVHLLLYNMAISIQRWELFFNADTAGNGIFSEHLNTYLTAFQKDPRLAETMKRVIAGKGCADVNMAERLESAGLVKRDENQNVICFCGLYTEYFGKKL